MLGSLCTVLPWAGGKEPCGLPPHIPPARLCPRRWPSTKEFIFKLSQRTENSKCLNPTCSQEELRREQNCS